MKTLGIVGGIAPESTVDYYRGIVSLYRERLGDGSYPSIIINSIDLQKLLGFIGGGNLAEAARYLLAEVARLAKAGADFCLFASNTPHLIFDDLERGSPLPLISIVEAAGDAASALGLEKVALLGTRFTMQGGFYQKIFARRRIEVVVPGPEEQEYVHDHYLAELVNGIIRDETRQRIAAIMERMKKQERIQAVILGGTELPLLFRDGPQPDIRLLDTTKIHVERAVAHLLAKDAPARRKT
jgi:aspartate racemase